MDEERDQPEASEPPRLRAGDDARKDQTITDRVYATIRHDVLRCRWPAGERLKIRDIALELGVSPMPVRLALKRLGEEGTLLVEENKSARIPFASRQSFNEYMEISIALETLAVERATANVARALAVELRAEVEAWQLALEAGDVGDYALRFNGLLMKLYQEGGSQTLIDMIEQVWIRTAPPSREVFAEKGKVVRINAALIAIMDAVAEGDAAGAKETLVSILQYVGKSANLFLDMDQDMRLKPKRRRTRDADLD